MAPSVLSVNTTKTETEEENVLAILALMTLVIFFLAYCCWDTSYCHNLISRLNFCHQENIEALRNDESNLDQSSANPTIILLPYGRILVVDGTIFARFHGGRTGLDLFELGESMLREEQNQAVMQNRLGSLSGLSSFSSDANRKDTTPTTSPLPPTYESIFGDYQICTPPPYSEVLRETTARDTQLPDRTDDNIKNRESTV